MRKETHNLTFPLYRTRMKAEESGGRKPAGSNPIKTMKNTIVGSSLIFTSAVYVLTGGILGTSPHSQMVNIAPAFWFLAIIPFILGMYFFIFARDKPSP